MRYRVVVTVVGRGGEASCIMHASWTLSKLGVGNIARLPRGSHHLLTEISTRGSAACVLWGLVESVTNYEGLKTTDLHTRAHTLLGGMSTILLSDRYAKHG